jgi:hypothetical protein
MTSVETNEGAMAALQTLRSITGSLNAVQAQVSSGLRVAKASDDAAYWAIATIMRSDRAAISAVHDALGLGAAKVDVAYTGMSSVIDILGDFKSKLVAAAEEGVDKAKIQTELDQLKQQVVRSLIRRASLARTGSTPMFQTSPTMTLMVPLSSLRLFAQPIQLSLIRQRSTCRKLPCLTALGVGSFSPIRAIWNRLAVCDWAIQMNWDLSSGPITIQGMLFKVGSLSTSPGRLFSTIPPIRFRST